MRRNSRASGEEDERRTKNGSGEKIEDDDVGTEQSQKKQRIVSFDQGSSDKIDRESDNFMDTSIGIAIEEQDGVQQLDESEQALLLNRPPRL